ncbi:MAG TPA: glycosyltransferase [Thermococcus sp.]|nr:glycosyltransferase [Thermococcus sp.]
MKKVGVISVWFERGAGYIAYQIASCLQEWGWDVRILARPTNVKGLSKRTWERESFEFPVVVSPSYEIPQSLLSFFIRDLDVIFFIEEHFTLKHTIPCLESFRGKVFNYAVWESVNPQDKELYERFDALICPTYACYKRLKNYGLKNVFYMRWGIDVDYWRPGPLYEGKRKTRFFFCEGWGGMYGRKNFGAVMEAFSYTIPTKKCELYIHSQYPKPPGEALEGLGWKRSFGNESRNKILRAYHFNDVTLIPSKWEGLGLNLLESLSCGRPVITVAAPPMNEIVTPDCGLLCNCILTKQQGVFVDVALVDVKDLAMSMLFYADNPMMLIRHQQLARQRALQLYNWEENKWKLKELL